VQLEAQVDGLEGPPAPEPRATVFELPASPAPRIRRRPPAAAVQRVQAAYAKGLF